MCFNFTYIKCILTDFNFLSVKIMTKYIEKDLFSFNHILCLYILPFIYSTLNSAHFDHANTQMLLNNSMQSVVMAATCMFLWTSITVNHTQYTSALWVSGQQCLSVKLSFMCKCFIWGKGFNDVNIKLSFAY